MSIANVAFGLVVAIGLALTTFQTLLTIFFRRRGRFFGGGPHERASSSRPAVSIIKPVCGLDDELEQNLVSFTALRGVGYEVLFSVAEADDPALAVIERVRREHPSFASRVIVGGDPRLERLNRKVARLIAAEPYARGEIVVISDSNVRTEPDDLAQTIAAFDDLRVGCVSNLFTGAGAETAGAAIESLHLLGFVAAGNVLAAFAKVPCVVGKSMAISRRALAAVGGFRRFARVLAEDQAIGLAVREAGFAVALSPVVVRNVVVRRTIRRALDRQIRWNKIRYAFSKTTYTSELLLNPLPFALLATLFGAPLSLPLLTIALRITQLAALSAATNARLTWRQLALTPLLDLLQFGAQFVPYANDRVTWRGHTARIGPLTELIEIAA